MADLLETRLQRVRRRIRQVVWLYGLSWVVVVLFGSTFLAGFLDWLLHLNDPGIRLILGLGIAGLVGWIAWRSLIGPLRTPFSNLDLAIRIEHRYPGFQDSLSSTVQFLSQPDNPRWGSPALQRRVIDSTLQRIEGIDVFDLVETRPIRRVTGAAVLLCLTIAAIVGTNQATAATALNRLLFPFSSGPWPKQTELQLLTSDFRPLIPDEEEESFRVARGDTLELFIENLRGSLPDDSVLIFRYGEDDSTIERARKTTLRDDRGQHREVGVVTLLANKGPLEFRAIGGDDDEMPWFRLDVVPPPLVESLNITVTPPEYTGRPVEQLAEGVGHVQGLIGTHVDVRAAANMPLRSARLRVKDQSPRRIELSEDGRSFRTSFEISEAGVHSYWFELVGWDGFENSEAPRYEIRGIADTVPNVYLDQPSTDLQVTPEAIVPVRVVAQDDLGIKDVRLHYKFHESETVPAQFLELHSGGANVSANQEASDQLVLDHDWELSELSLSHGMRVLYHAEATDYFDLGPEHVGRSVARSLLIVSPEEKLAELAGRQSGLLEILERVFKTQQRAHAQSGELTIQLENTGRLRPEDVDLLKRIELEQRQISFQLSNPLDGVEIQARQTMAELERNQIRDPELEQRLDQITTELALLREDHFPRIEQELTQARKMFQGNEEPGERGSSSGAPNEPHSDSTPTRDRRPAVLNEARDHQQAVLDSLDSVLNLLSQWQHKRDTTEDLRELIAGQETLNQEAARVGQRTLTKPFNDLTPQEQADLARLADRQSVQAEHLEQLANKLNNMAQELADSDRATADLLSDAFEQLRNRMIAGQMHEAARNLKENRIGQATAKQQSALEELKDLEDVLQNRSSGDTEALVKKLKQAEEELDTLRKQQDELLKKSRESAEVSDPQQRQSELQRLQKEQQQLRDEADRMARRLRRLQARDSSAATRRAGNRMKQAQQQLEQGEQQQAEANQQEALDDLEQAQRELAQTRREVEEQLARELLERMSDTLQAMIQRQHNVIDETLRLNSEYERRGNWTRGQLRSLLNLSEEQRQLQHETEALQKTLEVAEVFALAVQGAVRQMTTAADRLRERKTDDRTVAAEQFAKQRLVDLIDALKPEPGMDAQAGADGGAGEGGEGPPGERIPHLAQLKMLKTLQEDINRRTEELDEILLREGKLSDAELSESEMLAVEQGQLADLARNLMRAVTEIFDAEDEEPDGGNTEPVEDSLPENFNKIDRHP